MKFLQYNHQGSFDYLILWIQKGFIGFQILFYYFDWFFNCLIMQRLMHYFHRIWLFMNAPGSVSKYLLSHSHYLHSFRSSQTEVFTLSLPEMAKPHTSQLSTKFVLLPLNVCSLHATTAATATLTVTTTSSNAQNASSPSVSWFFSV